MTEIDYILLNEELDNYLNFIKLTDNSFYTNNLELFLSIANQLQINTRLQNVKDNNTISILEGIDYIKNYLEQLNPSIARRFLADINKGLINFNNPDDDYIIENNHYDDLKGENITEINPKNITISNDDQYEYIHIGPKSFINIENKVTKYSRLPTIIHEFFHTLNRDDKSFTANRNLLTEFISIYFEFDFINYMAKQGFSKELFLKTNIYRYNSTVSSLSSFIESTKILMLKIKTGVIDQYSCDIENMDSASKDSFLSSLARINKVIDKRRKNRNNTNYIPLFDNHFTARYLVGVPLAYLLSKSEDPEMPQKMLSVAADVNKKTTIDLLTTINLRPYDIKTLNYNSILNDFRSDIIETQTKKNKSHHSSNL